MAAATGQSPLIIAILMRDMARHGTLRIEAVGVYGLPGGQEVAS